MFNLYTVLCLCKVNICHPKVYDRSVFLEDLDGGDEYEDAEHEGADGVDNDPGRLEVDGQGSNKHAYTVHVVH